VLFDELLIDVRSLGRTSCEYTGLGDGFIDRGTKLHTLVLLSQ